MEHYGGIAAGYAVSVGVFWGLIASGRGRGLVLEAYAARRPALEIVFAILSVIAVIGVGQLYIRGWLLEDEGELFQSLNQILIFAPVLVLAVVRGQSRKALMLPSGLAIMASLLTGLVLAGIALGTYLAARGLTGDWNGVVSHLADRSHISLAVQVLLEDVTIAFLLARLRAATGTLWAIVIVAVLFQLAHIPAFLANGATLETLSSLVLDTAIGLTVFGAILKSRNILWFWPIHVVLDLMQFY